MKKLDEKLIREIKTCVNENDLRYNSVTSEKYNVNQDFSISIKEVFGGHEGGGEEHFIVFELFKNDENLGFYKVPGYYTSYNGSELYWNDTYKVNPVEVTNIEWQKDNS